MQTAIVVAETGVLIYCASPASLWDTVSNLARPPARVVPVDVRAEALLRMGRPAVLALLDPAPVVYCDRVEIVACGAARP